MSRIKVYRLPLMIAAIQWLITTILQVDRLFVTYDIRTMHFIKFAIFIATKSMYLMFLLISWSFIFAAYRKVKAGDETWKRGLFIFKVYLSIMMLLLLTLWPGTWNWDDIFVLLIISDSYAVSSWQHFFTGMYQSIFVQILPFPGGVILLQNVLISVCVAFTVTKLEETFNLKRIRWKFLDALVKVLPFLMPPVLMYQFSGYRMGLYVYLELVMLVMLIGAAKEKESWSLEYTSLFIILCIVVSAWRTESFFYVPAACGLILFANKGIIPNRRKVLCVLAIVAGFVFVTECQRYALGNSNYEVVSVIRQSTELVKAADPQTDAALLSDIDKVAKSDVVYQNPTLTGDALYWSYDIVRDGYTDQDYHGYLRAVVKLSLKYPKTLFVERWNTFLQASGIVGLTTTNLSTATLFDEGIENIAAESLFSKKPIAMEPLSKEIRKHTIYLLGLGKWDASGKTILQRLVWNSLLPTIVLIYAWASLLAKKKWYLWWICTVILIRLPIVILTEPSSWLMYHLSFYLLGYLYLVYRLLIKRNQNLEK